MNIREEKAAIVKQAFCDALEKLMRKKDLTDISINEVCSCAGMSRTTFYRYFEDKYELSRWRLKNMIGELDRASIDPVAVETTMVRLMAEIGARKHYYRKLFSYVGQNSLEEFFYSVFCEWAQLLSNKALVPQDRYALQYNASGMTGVMKRWLNENSPIAIQDVSVLLLSLAPRAQ